MMTEERILSMAQAFAIDAYINWKEFAEKNGTKVAWANAKKAKKEMDEIYKIRKEKGYVK